MKDSYIVPELEVIEMELWDDIVTMSSGQDGGDDWDTDTFGLYSNDPLSLDSGIHY